ncbi:hypothetical protein E2I00_008836, partial [Balaenoptera physalus]
DQGIFSLTLWWPPTSGTTHRHLGQASRKTKKKEGGALRAQRASSNVFSNSEQTQTQEFKEVRPCSCTGNPSTQKLMPEGSPGKCNAGAELHHSTPTPPPSGSQACPRSASAVKPDLTSRGLGGGGTGAEETILNAFKMLDSDGKGSINKD